MAIMYANEFVKKKWRVTLIYPIVENPFYYYFQFPFLPKILLNLLLCFWNQIKKNGKQSTFRGCKITSLHKRVRLKKYFFKPSNSNFPDADFLVILQSYLFPFLDKINPRKGIKIDCVAGSDYEKDSSAFGRFWQMNCSKLYPKYPHVKRFVLSRDSAIYHQTKGISITGVVPNGVDIKNFRHSHLSQKQFSILMFCDSKPAKGFCQGIDIIKQIKLLKPEVKVYAIGQNTKGLDLSVFDHYYGEMSDSLYAEAYRKHMFFLYTSVIDGFPAPPLEAMACGACCVLSKVPGVNDYGQHEKNSLLCRPTKKTEFVNCLIRLMDNPHLRRKIHNGAISTARRYSWAKSAKKMERFLTYKN